MEIYRIYGGRSCRQLTCHAWYRECLITLVCCRSKSIALGERTNIDYSISWAKFSHRPRQRPNYHRTSRQIHNQSNKKMPARAQHLSTADSCCSRRFLRTYCRIYASNSVVSTVYFMVQDGQGHRAGNSCTSRESDSLVPHAGKSKMGGL